MTLARPLVPRRELLRIFTEDRLVSVIRTKTAAQARATARAMADAGVRLIEITLTVPDALALIEELASDTGYAERGCVIGAGTVLNGQ
ncbi:MAG TPA: hypothetical protein VFM93_10895, partial [Candidatus Limnocylindria bacterium]|nr:hypothetical protein [Candidatus Limnocylindria bacterium]